MTSYPDKCQNTNCNRPRLFAERYCDSCLLQIGGRY